MTSPNNNYAQQFRKNVSDKYIIYNSLFAALPYSGVANVGALLPILLQTCEEGYAKKKSPNEIIDYFFTRHTQVETETEKIDHLFLGTRAHDFFRLTVQFQVDRGYHAFAFSLRI